MASKPLVVGQQRNAKLTGPSSAAGLPAIVNSDGQIVNASGFSGYTVNGGPVVQNVPVLSSPTTFQVRLSADQCVGGEIHMGAAGNQEVTFPTAQKILSYLTSANCRSNVRALVASPIGQASLPLGPDNSILQSSVVVPSFETNVYLAANATVNFVCDAGCGFKNDLSSSIAATSRIVSADSLWPERFTFRFYIVNTGGLSAPNDQPQIDILMIRSGKGGPYLDD